jgi:subtilisin
MAKASRPTQPLRYVILPPRGLSPSHGAGMAALGAALGVIGTPKRPRGRGRGLGITGDSPAAAAGPTGVRLVDTIDDGAKLVEMSAAVMMKLRADEPGLRIVPEVFFKTMEYQPGLITKFKKKARAAGLAMVSTKITLTVRSKAGATPIAGVKIVAFTDFEARAGLEGVTDAKGQATLDFGTASKKLDRLYAFPELGFWGALRIDTTIKDGTALDLDPIDLAFDDCVRWAFGRPKLTEGQGVRVGVVDTGVDTKHPDLKVSGGLNAVAGEDDKDFGDNGAHHGTHVAGIIAARGAIPGVAPAAELFSYRVFPKVIPGVDNQASNFAISKAIAQAVTDKCDLINMSLGGGDPDEATRSAIADARAAGSLVLVAVGNDHRQPVSFPANDPRSVAVAAMGRKGTFPAGSDAEGDVLAPFGPTKATQDDFVAEFSNVGPEVDVIGPGVGVVSTVPGGYGIMSGTSMACPAVTGATARLLANNHKVLAMPRDQARSDEIARLLFQAAAVIGFGPDFEGHGLPKA